MSPKPLGRVAIIGAGPTGLGAAWRLKELGHEDFRVYEAADGAGGLASSFVDERGFTWDIGVHAGHSHYRYYDDVLDGLLPKEEWLIHRRQARIWLRGGFVPYPFQYNIRHLPKTDLERCLQGLAEVSKSRPAGKPEDFGEWILAGFGRGIADIFMNPYNFKVWGYPVTELGYGWIGDRVAVVDLTRVKENIRLGRDETLWGPNAVFRFPRKGGTGAIWKEVARRVGMDKLRLRAPVRSLHAGRRELRLDSGTERFDHLLNTGALDRFASMVEDLPEPARRRAKDLKATVTNALGVALKGRCPERLRGQGWIYFPEDDCDFHRVTVFSNYSPFNVPDPRVHWSLLIEVNETSKRPVRQATLVDDTLRGLRNTRLIDPEDEVLGVWRLRAEHGYPTPFLGRDEVLADLQGALEAVGLHSRGRFGAWKYEVSNQDHSFMQGVEWVDRVRDGKPEPTVTDPALVNSNRFK